LGLKGPHSLVDGDFLDHGLKDTDLVNRRWGVRGGGRNLGENATLFFCPRFVSSGRALDGPKSVHFLDQLFRLIRDPKMVFSIRCP